MTDLLPPSTDDDPDEGYSDLAVPASFHDNVDAKPENDWFCPKCEEVGKRTSAGRCSSCGFHPRKRAENAGDVVLGPDSLVGSWFHRIQNDEVVWGGVVIGEPQSGVYMVSVDQGRGVTKPFQTLVPIAGMVSRTARVTMPTQSGMAEEGRSTEANAGEMGMYEWRFFDSPEERTLAYVKMLEAERKA